MHWVAEKWGRWYDDRTEAEKVYFGEVQGLARARIVKEASNVFYLRPESPTQGCLVVLQ